MSSQVFIQRWITAAIVSCNETGHGQKIEINLLSSILSGMVNQSGAYAGAGVIPHAMGNAHPSISPYEAYRTKDKQIIIAVGNDGQFAKMCSALNAPFATDSRFSTNSDRVLHREELNLLMSAILLEKGADEWVAALNKVGVPAGPINNIEQAIQLAERLDLDPIVTIKDSRDGTISKTIANPIRFSETPNVYRYGPPSLGIDE